MLWCSFGRSPRALAWSACLLSLRISVEQCQLEQCRLEEDRLGLSFRLRTQPVSVLLVRSFPGSTGPLWQGHLRRGLLARCLHEKSDPLQMIDLGGSVPARCLLAKSDLLA